MRMDMALPAVSGTGLACLGRAMALALQGEGTVHQPLNAMLVPGMVLARPVGGRGNVTMAPLQEPSSNALPCLSPHSALSHSHPVGLHLVAVSHHSCCPTAGTRHQEGEGSRAERKGSITVTNNSVLTN